MDIRALKAFLAGPMEEVSTLLEASLRSDIALLDATNRSLLAQGGKLMRPMLSLLSAGACGGINGDSVRFAAAAEMIHNATLLHDDVVDGAATRRGKPTVMSLLSSPASVLIGDFWLVKAIRCILDADRYSERAIRLFAKTLSDLAEGEMLQLEKASCCDTTREDYLRIIYSKTARNLGLAFQIKDDILDYAGNEALGKPVGIDLKEQKITLPLLCALESAPAEEAAEIRALVGRISDEPALADRVRAFVLERKGVERAVADMGKYIDEAVSCLDELPPSAEKPYLVELARFVGERTF